MAVAIILLAAGRSSRMRGADKLMAEVRGKPLLRDRADMALRSRARDNVIVVLPTDRPERKKTVQGLPVTIIENPVAEDGMSTSIKAGLKAVPSDCNATLMMPADMPNVTSEHLDHLIAVSEGAPDTILRASGPDRIAKSPTLLPRSSFHLFETLEGDAGGRHLIKSYDGAVQTIALDGPNPTLDLDTPEDWAAFSTALDE